MHYLFITTVCKLYAFYSRYILQAQFVILKVNIINSETINIPNRQFYFMINTFLTLHFHEAITPRHLFTNFILWMTVWILCTYTFYTYIYIMRHFLLFPLYHQLLRHSNTIFTPLYPIKEITSCLSKLISNIPIITAFIVISLFSSVLCY